VETAALLRDEETVCKLAQLPSPSYTTREKKDEILVLFPVKTC